MTIGPDEQSDPAVPEILAYEASIAEEVRKRMGPRLDLVKPHVGTLFPNFSMLRSVARVFRVWHPRGPGKTEIWNWVFVDKAAPPEVKAAFRLMALRAFGPSGGFEQDDMDNWQECTQTARGVVSRRHMTNISMGLGHESYDPDLLGWVSDYRITENNHRHFYSRWAEVMASDSWKNL